MIHDSKTTAPHLYFLQQMPNGLFSMLNPWLQSIDGAAIFIQHGVHIIITVILVVDLFPKPAEELVFQVCRETA